MEQMVKNISKSITDNLKDAQMAYDWAKEAKACEMNDLATYFISRAKVRLQMMSEDQTKMSELLKKMGDKTEEKGFDPHIAFYDYFIEQKDELEYCLNHFKM